MDLETLRRTVLQRLASDARFGMTHLPKAGGTFDLSFLDGLQRPAEAEPPRTPAGGAKSSNVASARAAGGGALFDTERFAGVPESTPVPGGVDVTPPNETKSATPRPQRVNELAVLSERVSQCVRCTELAETRNKTVFGVGNPEAALLFLGEAPGADEDKTGEPFVGRAGQLLDKIIAACRLTRDDIYICNILKCRPPGNRNPTPAEAGNCREYLSAQMATVDPEYIVCWGRVAAENLLGTKEAIGKLRKRFFKYGRAKVAVTYHPSYLLRNPAAKKDVWDDLKWLFRDMGVDLDAARGSRNDGHG